MKSFYEQLIMAWNKKYPKVRASFDLMMFELKMGRIVIEPVEKKSNKKGVR